MKPSDKSSQSTSAISMAYKKVCLILFSFTWINALTIFAQEQRIADSLAVIYQQKSFIDSAELELLKELSFNELRNTNKGLEYAEELIKKAEKNGNKKFIRIGYFLKGNKEKSLGNLDKALRSYFKSAEIARELKQLSEEGESYGAIADTYSVGNNSLNAITYYNNAINILRQTKDSISLASYLLNAGDQYRKTKKYQTALSYFNEAKPIFDKFKHRTGQGYSLGNIGMVYADLGRNYMAEKYMEDGIRILRELQDYYPVCEYLLSMADIYLDRGDTKRALDYASRSLLLAEQYGLKEQIEQASLKLSELYEKEGNTNESYRYFKKHIVYRDSINNIKRVQKMADLRTNYEVSQKQVEVDLLNKQKQNERYLTISLATILGLMIFIVAILIRSNKHKQKAYKVLNLQKQETDKQRAKVENALDELQNTQRQLIQAAKMASLGELTAGIAHEIQNPLNFVNNFAEVTAELLGELREEVANKLSGADKASAEEIIDSMDENLRKIAGHGKRADSIVKGMLQHSRSSTGKKEPTDINTLADEYLRLSYHGLRAKDKAFRANFTSNFDESIGKVEILPQDIGRVLLNLYNNAFYAVNEKAKLLKEDYQPLVSVTTARLHNKIELSVKDNGDGIPEKILDKIFQPFFTTKPSGQGTGLGLSLSYDIVKAHGGEIKVETKEGAFTEFIIQLPVNGLMSKSESARRE